MNLEQKRELAKLLTNGAATYEDLVAGADYDERDSWILEAIEKVEGYISLQQQPDEATAKTMTVNDILEAHARFYSDNPHGEKLNTVAARNALTQLHEADLREARIDELETMYTFFDRDGRFDNLGVPSDRLNAQEDGENLVAEVLDDYIKGQVAELKSNHADQYISKRKGLGK